MDNIWPLWALPFWTMGVPLVWAVVELMRIPRRNSASASSALHSGTGLSGVRRPAGA